MLRSKSSLLLVCALLGACASTSPEDVRMSDAMCSQGKSLLSAGKNVDARDIYESAAHRNDQNARAWNGLGVADDLLGKKAAAKEAYQHAVDLAPTDLTSLNNLAHIYIEMNDPETAVQLLEPYAADPTASQTMQQNLEVARKMTQAKQDTASDNYAELGSYPTEGMADGHLREAQSLLNDKTLTWIVETEVKTGGGIPTFTVKVTGRSPKSICSDLASKAFPCIPHGNNF